MEREYVTTWEELKNQIKENSECCFLYQVSSGDKVLSKVSFINGEIKEFEGTSHDVFKQMLYRWAISHSTEEQWNLNSWSEKEKTLRDGNGEWNEDYIKEFKTKVKENKEKNNVFIGFMENSKETKTENIKIGNGENAEKINTNRKANEFFPWMINIVEASGDKTNWKIEYELEDTMNRKIKDVFGKDNKQLIFTGAPGTGKTYSVQKYIEEQCEGRPECYKFINFHSSYDYTDFVEGIRPISLPFEDNPDDKKMKFVKIDGTFKAFCRKAATDFESKNTEEIPNYYFMIDEINRADLAKVFGELMLCLEEGYRGKKKTVQTQYQNIPTVEIIDKVEEDNEGNKKTSKYLKYIEKDIFEEGFYVPENVYIIGTMNNIDRSVDTFDFALRRRFQWEEISANEQMLETVEKILYVGDDKYKNDTRNYMSRDEITEVVNRLKAVNVLFQDKKYKKYGLSEDYHLGASYLKRIEKVDGIINYRTVWNNNIYPILKEYVRGFDGSDDFIKACKSIFLKEGEKKKNDNDGTVSDAQ